MTPASTVKTLKIDGHDFSARPDETILDVARENKIFIPRMCELEGLSTVGACRLCLVEVKGSNKLMASCVTRVEEGMEVTTVSERLQNYRRMIVELLFSERTPICSVACLMAIANFRQWRRSWRLHTSTFPLATRKRKST